MTVECDNRTIIIMTPGQQAPSRCKHPSCFYSNKQQPHTKAGCACCIPCCHEAPSESDWEKRFDKAFSVNVDSDDFEAYPEPSQIKAFIRKVRSEAVEEALEKVVGDNPQCLRESCDLAEVLRRVAEIKKEL